MLYLIYDILLHVVLVALLPYFAVKMLVTGKYKSGVAERFGFVRPNKAKFFARGKVVWVHAVSVGETRAVLPVVRALKDADPYVLVLFSTVTATGNAVAEKELGRLIDGLIFFPLDVSWAIKRVVRTFSPSLLVIVEKEVWPNVIRIMRKRGAPVVVVNGTLSERSTRRYSTLSFLFKDVFSSISLYLARTEEDASRAMRAGVPQDRIKVMGNVKFDLSAQDVKDSDISRLRASFSFAQDERVIVAGSTHRGEEEAVIEVYERLLEDFKGLKLVIAPRHPERFPEVEGLLKKRSIEYAKRTHGRKADVVLLDTVGELSRVYSVATVAFVGGSLAPIGGHNLLEPALFGVPVVWGPHVESAKQMADMLVECKGGFMAKDKDALCDVLKRLLSDEALRVEAGAKGRALVEANRGASSKSAKAIAELMGPSIKGKGKGKGKGKKSWA